MAMNSLSVLGGNFATKGELSTAGGLVHINTTTFSAVSSVSLNTVFTSTYENYLIQMVVSASSVDGSISQLRLRAAGTDAATNYFHSTSRTYWSGSLAFYTSGNPATIYYINENSSNAINMATIQFFTPNLVTKTAMTHTAIRAGQAAEFGGCSHGTAAAYDGFSISANSGTITGTIRVYGYKNS